MMLILGSDIPLPKLARPSRPNGFSLRALLFIFTLAACGLQPWPSATPPSEFAAEVNDPDVLQANAGIQIPTSATHLHGFVDGFQQPTTYVRFSLSADDIDAFMGTTLCKEALTPVALSSFPESPVPPLWWSLEAAQALSYCGGSAEHLFQEVFVAEHGTFVHTVYVLASIQ